MEVEITPLIQFLFGLACFLVGFSKGGFGGVLGFLITPMLALVMPLNIVVGIMLPVLMIGDCFTIAAYWKKWDVSRIWVLLIGAIAGVTVATLVLVNTPVEWLKRGLAVLVLIFAAYRFAEKKIKSLLVYKPQTWHGYLAGGTAGFASTLAHAGGPPITIYLLLQSLDPIVFVGTSALFFTILNWIKAPFYLAGGLFDFHLLMKMIWLVGLIPVGVIAGKHLVNVINKVIFDRIVLFFLVLSAILLLT